MNRPSSTNYEPYLAKQATEVFPHIDFVPRYLIDCGPGLGQEAHRFAEQYPGIQIIGLEPNYQVYKKILTDYPGTLLNTAAWSCEGMADMFCPEGEMGSSLVVDVRRDGKGLKVSVPTTTVDLLDAGLGLFEDAVLWADVEWAELRVLEGADWVLRRGGIRLLNLEVHDGDNEAEVDKVCTDYGFEKVFSYAHNGTHHDNVYRRTRSKE
jgi:FkbM family methyltransferase